MVLGALLFLAVVTLVHRPLMVSDYTDLATLHRLQEHEKLLEKEMGHLQEEFDQEDWNWASRACREDWVPTDLTPEDVTWDGWPYVGVVILLLFGCCRHSMEKEPSDDSSVDSSSTCSSEDFDDTENELDADEPKQRRLQAFYDHYIKADMSDLAAMCSFVECFVNDLLEACRNALPSPNTLLLLENCIGVNSAFEGWHAMKECHPFSVLVPVLPPKGHSLHIKTSDSEGAPRKHGHVKVDLECVCKRERLLGDVTCFLHHPEHTWSKDEEGNLLLHALCSSSHLDVEKTVRWFQNLVGKAWKSIQQKYNLKVLPQPSSTTCRLELAFRSGRSIQLDIILGVQQGDSLVFLATHDAERGNSPGGGWQRTFAIQELLFFKWVSQQAPKECCHLKCLQLLLFFKESSPSDQNVVLTSYHYKTCLMHLLLLQPLSDWKLANIVRRLQDLLLFMQAALREKHLEHFLVGNLSLPVQIPMPKALRSADPLNLFEHLAQDSCLHAKAVEEFVEVVEQVRALLSDLEE
ncbi:inositol 1,4,5-trisphosphate receptor-interacting protein-like 1 [Varanus komodoensis]|uniref:inositol 1,4,5-trisphosphate receptor-interacting protein-like 1 n=1 Tax=Varanus komodoensis TaxID=61221 RepID=UPI001CF7D737|nr:inositol 1,4,5-trisphosphate receptor-interacting protein-like 1 [Varanus komodoensis]